MKKLVLLKSELEFLKESINKRIIFLNKKLKRTYKSHFYLMHVIVLLCIVMNFGAVFLTNMLVMEANPDAQLVEANPVMAKVHDLEAANVFRGMRLVFMIAFQGAIWAILLFSYFYAINHIYTKNQLYISMIIAFFYFIVLGLDFFNDFGFLAGRILGGM